jgi:hypothetical protein
MSSKVLLKVPIYYLIPEPEQEKELGTEAYKPAGLSLNICFSYLELMPWTQYY